MARTIDIHVKLDPKTFRGYCAFDTFRRQRRWYPPIMAGMVLVTLSAALLLTGKGTGAAGALMGLGIAVPMVVFGLYFIQIEAQIARQKLKQAPAVYSLSFTAEGVRVVNDQKEEAPVDLSWDRLWAAFRRADCIYLYVNPERAFILPDGQASVSPDALWTYLKRHLGESRCTDRK